ncbi:MAG: hypothetical protein IJT72_02685 [Lachnospiraceae bacterium]|nr:hypothetical protein [Lachnospiraceae bacterium]
MADDMSGNVSTRTHIRKPTVNFNFMLRIEALYDVPCKDIKVIRKENEYDYIQEGGVNDFVHMIRKPISKPFTLQIERYVGEKFYDPLSLGTKLLLPVFLSVGRYLNPSFFLPDRQYIFTGCEVMSKEYGELNAERPGLLTETTTIAFSRMYTIDSPFDGTKESWQYDGTKEGTGTSYRNKIMDEFELSKEEMAARTQRWSMAQNYGGKENRTEQTVSSRQNLYGDIVDLSKEDMEKKAKKWKFEGDNKEGNKESSAMTPEKKGIQNPETASAGQMAERAIQWQFDTKENFGGKGESARANVVPVRDKSGNIIGKAGRGITEDRANVMEERASLWKFDDKNPSGNGIKNRQNYTETTDENGETTGSGIGARNASKEEMINNANLWSFDGDNPAGNGVKNRQNYSEFTDENGNTTGSGIGTKEMTIAEMEAKANRWPEAVSAKTEKMTPKATLEEQARHWPPTRSAKTIADFLSKS